jgi:hypothetical protein
MLVPVSPALRQVRQELLLWEAQVSELLPPAVPGLLVFQVFQVFAERLVPARQRV